MSRRTTTTAFLAVLCLASAAFAHDHDGGNAAGKAGHGATSEVRSLTILEHDGAMVFSPTTMRVKRGETIRFDVTNAGKLPHEFRIDTVAGNVEHAIMMRDMPNMKHDEGNSLALAPGAVGRLDWTFTHIGTFQFACLIPGHFEAGMHGTIVVER